MKICFMCDLHLPFDKNALQYDVLEWAIEDIRAKNPDCIAYAGDVTCDGNLDVYKWFIEKMQSIQIPFLFIPGNSDLRSQISRNEIKNISSKCENFVAGTKIFAVNDSEATVSDDQLSLLEKANDDSIVFMHHPMASLSESSYEKMLDWRGRHPKTFLFYGHLHETKILGNSISLQALDPDKAIGECPCVSYFDTDTKKLDKSHYLSPVPADFYSYFGISCYSAVDHVKYATERKLKNIELRPNCIQADREELKDCIAKWRSCGGEDLCIHLPDISYNDGNVKTDNIDSYIDLANLLKVNRFTQHVPIVSVKKVKENPEALDLICNYLSEKLNRVDHEVTVGVENMHMTAKDMPDDTRRFGYIPEECIMFMKALRKSCKHKVGINFDIGHARNNAPYSQKYQTSTWLSQIGKYAVGYHIHQVTLDENGFSNHMPITDVYGKLISFASFFKCWDESRINKAPLIFEMRPQGSYDITLKIFDEQKSL